MPLEPIPTLTALVANAEAVTTVDEFDAFRAALAAAGAAHERPVGDMEGNVTAISASGDPQYLLFELVTNSIDGILERQAAELRRAGQAVPNDPRALAGQLWTGDAADVAERIVLRVRDSGESLRPTFTMRDREGIGISAPSVRRTIMSLGQSPKNTKLYLAGAFGKGGGTLHRESRGAVLIGRPSAALCAETGCADEIWITAVWATHEAGGKVRRWVYAVTDPFDPDHPADTGGILAFPAAGVDFEPGVMVTHVAYNAPDLARHTKAAVDSRSLWVMGNTRLYDPVLPWSYVDERDSAAEVRKTMYGRARNFRDGTPQQMRESPLVAKVPVQDPDTGEVHELAVSAFLFDRSARRNATARDHTVCFVTNGQVQAHWDAAETRKRTAEAQGSYTGLRRVAEQVLFVEVGCDAIPHVRRSEMVAPDRTRLTDNALARAVQTAVADWLVNQPTITELERDLAMNVSRGSSGIVIADKVLDEIGRKLGFTGVGAPTGDPPAPRPPEVLLPEPTQLTGPNTVTVIAGKTKQVSFALNAEDDFLGRGAATITFVVDDLESPVRGTPGPLSRGRFTTSVVLDDTTPEGVYGAYCLVEWLSAAGSMKELRWDLKVKFLHEAPEPTPPDPKPGARPLVLLRDEGGPESAGYLEDQITGADWAALEPEQAAHAAKAGDRRVVAIIVNEAFRPWERYADELARNTSDAEVTRRRNRYIVGTACAIGRLYGAAKAGDALAGVADELRETVAALCAESVIASLPPASVE
ncbi:MAG: hypothetical protein KY439_01230 [Actinobacteria bacterium]|nr:hypothetical protein [Actinomycetota bacterium]